MLVFLAEDDTPFADVLASFLRQSGYVVEVFEEGRSLVAALAERAPDVLVLDVILPGLDGPSILSWISESSHCSRLPVVIISALGSFGYAGAPVRLEGYLVKPFEGAELIRLIDQVARGPPGSAWISSTPSTTTPDGPTTQFPVPGDEE